MSSSKCVLFLMLLALFPIVSGSKCGPCDAEKCPDVSECDQVRPDECGCCQICIRQFGETCDEPAHACDEHLTCVADDDLDKPAVCKEGMLDECAKALCPIKFHACPLDSQLITPAPTPDNCCPVATCHCDQKRCAPSVPSCTHLERLVMVHKATDVPGKCCAVYECQKKDRKCSNVHCPPSLPDDDAECPADSIRAPDMTPKDACCPVRQSCRCRGAICRPALCPTGHVVHVVSKGNGQPGKCCDVTECVEEDVWGAKCVMNNTERQPMETWHATICETCTCIKGISVCDKMTCPKVNQECTWIGIPPGECCPICLGCQTDNQTKLERGSTWQKDDCTSCTCSDLGAHMCEKHMCKTDCENPRKVAGQCCPVCDEPTIIRPPATCPSLEHCALRCANGLRRDNIGCYVCECLPDEVPPNPRCRELNDENCEKQCAHGYLKDEDGCTVCKCSKCPPLHQCHKHCLYGFETNSAGCSLCKCRAASKSDKKASTTASTPKFGLNEYHSEKCISFSKDAHQIVRDGGEWWSDGCRHCFCENKQEFCSLISCPSKPSECPDEAWLQKDGECCPACSAEHKKSSASSSSLSSQNQNQKHEHTVCQSPGTGRLFTDGETWQLAPCVSCTCRVGHVLCRTAECPPIACANPEYRKENDCCPVCAEHKVESITNEQGETIVCQDESGAAHIVGSSWRQDDCTSCVCTSDGSPDCYKEACDESRLDHCRGNPLVIKGKCCPVCSDALSSSAVCSYQSSVYSIGEQWQDGRCSNCSCVAGGQTVCRQMVCPHCEEPVPIEGHCCPLCKDAKWGPFGVNGSVPPSLGPHIDDGSGSSALSLAVVSFMSLCVVGLVIVLMLLYKRNRKSNKLHKFNEVGQIASGGASTVRLSASKTIGSMPRLVDWKDTRDQEEFLKSNHHTRHDSQNSDDQSDSLLSTMSDTSTAPSTISSSGGHVALSDTQPLTPKRRYPV